MPQTFLKFHTELSKDAIENGPSHFDGLGEGNEEATRALTKSDRNEGRGYRLLFDGELATNREDNHRQAGLEEAPSEGAARAHTSRRNLRRQVRSARLLA